ncbi:RNA Polymerase II CTD phosphatase Fcp1 [Aspergillus luchuensis]|uniref:RNA polymerase II subunit A C-terminal domain phosphatase n=1 Tax=Aspergillus kawachii TaxID=1069201 RepID=A0A146FDF0_ASPKA|nr:RNA Polymerase II CTD phosphatase Fcp1 [Aspergillus luchuensis]
MLLRLPPSLHYPITVTSLLKQPGDKVERDEALFWYVYQTTVTEGDGLGNKVDVKRKFPTKFESTVDGEVVQWKIEKGDVIDEPFSYNTEVTDVHRAPIQMAHDNTTLTVSEQEATRVEEDAKRRLLANRKLSLVVDLDQTIIHATVDPTVGEWMQDKENPNYQALSDVRAFQLVDDGPGMRGCWYYVKLRPGLESFLQNVSEMYELHIYTMGTRSYAQHIASIIDPDRKLFGDRILSRDESGSLVAKNLHRLFPVDTKMVVIIDDRGDVWRWNPNLIKVSPYDFFVGIGDINSSFLPKKQELGPPSKGGEKPVAKAAKGGLAEHHVNGATAKRDDQTEVSTLEQLVTMGGGDNPRLLQEQSDAQEETIMHQVEDRPLLQKQKELDAEDDAAESSDTSSSIDDSQDLSKHRHHLLEDNDRELFDLEVRLEQVHRDFFDEYDRRRSRALGGRVAALRGEKPSKEKDVDLKLVPDVKIIMPQMKHRILGGRLAEEPYLLPVHPDDRGEPISPGSKEVAESAWLSSSDEATGDSVADDEEATEEILKSAGISEMSPLGYDDEEQAAVHDELKEFLGSDDESESDSEATFMDETGTPSASKKRKREEGDGGDDDDDDQDTDSAGEGDEPGSRLAQRIKRSYERSTGLKEVASAGAVESTASTTASATEPGTEEPEQIADESSPPDPAEVDPADEDDELEREMMAALEGGDYNSEAEEQIANENG